MRLLLRIQLRDEPGTLAAVTTALGALGVDLVALEVVSRDGAFAVDDLCLESPVGPSHVRRALAAVPGVVVEAVRGVERFRDVDAAVSLAAALVAGDRGEPSPAERAHWGGRRGGGAVRSPLGILLAGLPAALWVTWAAAVRTEGDGLRVIGAAGGVPDLEEAPGDWLPLAGPRPLDLDELLPPEALEPARRGGVTAAAAPWGGGAVVLARAGGPRFRAGELHALGQLTRIAEAVEGGGDPFETVPAAEMATAPAGRAATSGRS
jgi:hypothetical protein